MVGAEFHIKVANNENLVLNLQLLQDDVARDLTGYTVDMQARESGSNDTISLDFSSYITVTPATGSIAIDVPAAIVAANLTLSIYQYDLLLIETATSDVNRILYGNIKLLQGVTR